MATNTNNSWEQINNPTANTYGPPTYDEWASQGQPKWWQSLFGVVPDLIGLFDTPETPSPNPVPTPTPAPENSQNLMLNIGILAIFGVIAFYLIKKMI